MFDQLKTMLLRLHSLPFRLRIPHRPHIGPLSEYVARVLDLEGLDIHRLALYNGPIDIFTQLNGGGLPLPTLTSLNISSRHSDTYMDMDGQFSARSLPNLRHLEARCLSFSTDNDPFPAMRHLTCSVSLEGDYQRLFERFPNLVDLELLDLDWFTSLPPVSLPRSLRSIVLRPDKFEVEALDVARLLRNWAAEPLPRVVLREAFHLHGTLPLFLASHAHRIALRLNGRDGELELATLPADGAASCTWTITPSRLIDEFLSGLETRGCLRLSVILVAIEQLGRLFAAQLDTPGLEILEFRIVGRQGWPPLQADDTDFFIRAPRLRHVVFNAGGSADAVRAHRDDINRALSDLHWSFRSLILYDADLLDSITLSAPAECVREINCAAFARFAKEYATRVTS